MTYYEKSVATTVGTMSSDSFKQEVSTKYTNYGHCLHMAKLGTHTPKDESRLTFIFSFLLPYLRHEHFGNNGITAVKSVVTKKAVTSVYKLPNALPRFCYGFT